MKRKIVIGLTFSIVLMMCVFFPAGEALSGDVDVSIGIGIGVPAPNIVIASPPSVYLIPGSYAYFAPDVGVQLFFYSGYWFLLNDGYWYRSSYYRGPWRYLPPARVPVVFLHLPSDYYRVPPGQKLIPYGQLKKNWKRWEKPQYRDSRDWEKNYHEQWRKQDEGYKTWRSQEKPGKVKEGKPEKPGKVKEGKPGKGREGKPGKGRD